MSVAFPVGVGLAMVLGVFINYFTQPKGDAIILFLGVFLILLAILANSIASGKVVKNSEIDRTRRKTGLLIAIFSGVLMAFFYRFVAITMDLEHLESPAAGMMTPYSALFVFALGIFLSNFLFNTIVMRRPFIGNSVSYKEYFKGNLNTHLVGLLGGGIWALGSAWRLSDEPLIKSLNVFDNLKLRLSAGQTGNQGVSAYATRSKFVASNYTYDGTLTSGMAEDRWGGPAAPDLKWETTTQYDLGLDASFLNNRANLVFDIYYKKTMDLLQYKLIPMSSGFSQIAWKATDFVIQNFNRWETITLPLTLTRSEAYPYPTYGNDYYRSFNMRLDIDASIARNFSFDNIRIYKKND